MSKRVEISMPVNQMGTLLSFTDEMLTEIEKDIKDMEPEQALALKRIRHIFNKVANQYREQTNEA
jgi:hypothetical protein